MTEPMSLAEMKEALPAGAELLHDLIGCEYGHGKVARRGDPEVCEEQAVRLMALHGTPVGTLELKLCARHYALLCEESTPREESP